MARNPDGIEAQNSAAARVVLGAQAAQNSDPGRPAAVSTANYLIRTRGVNEDGFTFTEHSYVSDWDHPMRVASRDVDEEFMTPIERRNNRIGADRYAILPDLPTGGDELGLATRTVGVDIGDELRGEIQNDPDDGKVTAIKTSDEIRKEAGYETPSADQPRPDVVSLHTAFQNSNALDEFDVPTCIWTLYMVEEKAFTDGASQSEIGQAEYYDRLRLTDSEYNKVILASSGRTDEYAISNVDFESVFGTLPGISTNIRFDILVPYGTQLLDVLIQGAQALGISHYGKVPFMLEMRVIGREPGEQRDSPNAGVSTSAGGPAKISKLFAIHITKMDSSLDAGGMRFHVSAVNYNDLHRHDVYNKLNAQATITGDTPKEMLDSLVRVLNSKENQAVSRQAVKNVKDEYEWRPTGDAFVNEILNARINSFEETGPARSVMALDAGGEFGGNSPTKISVTYDAGTKVTDIIENVMLNSSKLKTAVDELQQHNRRVEAEGDETADPKQIIKEFFNFEADVRPIAFDSKRDDYAKRVTYRISRYQTPFGLVSRTDLPKRPQHDKDGAIDLVNEYMILKYYEFMYMGNNDQILDLQYQFDNMFYVAIGDIRDEVSSASTDHGVTAKVSEAGIRANIGSAQNQLAGALAETAAERIGFTQLSADLFGTGGGDAGGLGGPVAGIVDSAVGAATAAAGDFIGDAMGKAKDAITANALAAASSVLDAATVATGGLIPQSTVNDVRDQITGYAGRLGGQLAETAAEIAGGIGGVTGPAAASIGSALQGTAGVAGDMFGNAGTEIADAARNIINPAGDVLGTIGSGLRDGLRGAAGAVGAGITTLADLQRHIRDSVAEQMDSGEESLLGDAGRALRKAGSKVVGHFSGAGNAVAGIAADVGGGIGGLAGRISGGVSDLFDDVSIPFPPTATDLFSKFNFNAKALLPKNSALSGLAKKANQITGGALDSLDFGFDGIEDLDDAVDRGREFVFDSVGDAVVNPNPSVPGYEVAGERTPWILYAGDHRLPDAAKYTRPAVEQTENRPTKGIENDGSPGGALLHRYFNSARTGRKAHAVADMVAVQMQIKFDPFYMPDLDSRLMSREERNRNISIARPLLIMVASRTPSEYDEETGLMRLTGQNALNGLYMVVAATHRFGEDGMATTSLEMKRLLNVDVHNFNITFAKAPEEAVGGVVNEVVQAVKTQAAKLLDRISIPSIGSIAAAFEGSPAAEQTPDGPAAPDGGIADEIAYPESGAAPPLTETDASLSEKQKIVQDAKKAGPAGAGGDLESGEYSKADENAAYTYAGREFATRAEAEAYRSSNRGPEYVDGEFGDGYFEPDYYNDSASTPR